MAAGIITYTVRVDGRIKSRALFTNTDEALDALELELFFQEYLPATEYVLDSRFAFIDDATKARICAEG